MSQTTMRTHVLLPKEVVEEIDRLVGPRKRSEFIERATRQALEREERLALFREFAGSLKDVDIPGWETPESTAAWVREQRAIERDDPWAERDLSGRSEP